MGIVEKNGLKLTETNYGKICNVSTDECALMLVAFNSMMGKDGPTAAQYRDWLRSKAQDGVLWKHRGVGRELVAFFRCTACGKEVVTRRMIGKREDGSVGPVGQVVLPYCPFCGKKMCTTMIDDGEPDFGFKGFDPCETGAEPGKEIKY